MGLFCHRFKMNLTKNIQNKSVVFYIKINLTLFYYLLFEISFIQHHDYNIIFSPPSLFYVK